jgi:hypothetical protein
LNPEFSLSHDAVDDMGNPAYLPVVLENNDSRMRAVVNFGAELPSSWTGLSDGEFTGGYSGDMSKITADDYAKGLLALNNSLVEYTAVLSLGCYDGPTLMALANHARDVRVDYFFDLPSTISRVRQLCWLVGKDSAAWKAPLAITSHTSAMTPLAQGKSLLASPVMHSLLSPVG